MPGFDIWLLVIMLAAFYILAGLICYLILESRQSPCNKPGEPDPFFTPWEMFVIVATWPYMAGYMAAHYLRRWKS
jgi:hypothetical protein